MVKVLGLLIFTVVMISISIMSWNKWHNVFLTTFITIVWLLMLLSYR